MKSKLLNKSEIEAYLQKCVNLPISDAWMGYGTAIFLELGKLYKRKDNRTYTLKGNGRISIMIEWSWRLESNKSIITGSFDTKKKMGNELNKLIGKSIKEISIFGRIPEICVNINQNRWLCSYATEKGQPEWAILFKKKGYLEVKKGKIYYTISNKRPG